MRGSARIELTDIKTGKTEVIEHHNIVTNALSEYFKYVPEYTRYNASVPSVNNYTEELWKEVLGGILLFDKTLDASANNVKSFGDATMIGQGSYGYANSSEVPELGSYSGTESGWQSDGSLRLVYDFTAAQACGTIASICLTSKSYGLAGAGRLSGKMSGSTAQFFDTDTLRSNIEEYQIVYADYAKNKAVYVKSGSNMTDGTITFVEQPLSLSNVLLNAKDAQTEKVVDLGSKIAALLDTRYNYKLVTYADGYIYIVTASGYNPAVPIDGTCYVIKIKDDYSSVELLTLPNSTGVKLNLQNNNSMLAVAGDYICLRTSYYDDKDYEFAFINLKKPTDCFTYNFSYGPSRVLADGDMFYLYTKNMGTPNNYVLNPKWNDRTPRMTDYAGYSSSYSYEIAPVKGHPLLLMYDYQYGSIYKRGFIKRTDYLATINNLNEPVEKTASKTMKITYTLRPEP